MTIILMQLVQEMRQSVDSFSAELGEFFKIQIHLIDESHSILWLLNCYNPLGVCKAEPMNLFNTAACLI